jgi:hypothetical protein
MTGELGQVLLLGALLVSILLCAMPMIGAHTGNSRLMDVGPRAALVQCLLVAGAFALLTWAFIVQDFSVEYVARNSNSRLPMEYRFSAVWGAHEGSLLLWELILSLWTAAVALLSRRLPDDFRARVLGVLGFVSAGFLLFILYTSNPFSRILPAAPEGMDLNPPAGPWIDHSPAHALHGLRRLLGVFCLRRGCIAGPAGYAGVGAMVAALDPCRLGIPDHWHCPGQLVGLLRTGLGRLVVLGSGENASFMPWLAAPR